MREGTYGVSRISISNLYFLLITRYQINHYQKTKIETQLKENICFGNSLLIFWTFVSSPSIFLYVIVSILKPNTIYYLNFLNVRRE